MSYHSRTRNTIEYRILNLKGIIVPICDRKVKLKYSSVFPHCILVKLRNQSLRKTVVIAKIGPAVSGAHHVKWKLIKTYYGRD